MAALAACGGKSKNEGDADADTTTDPVPDVLEDSAPDTVDDTVPDTSPDPVPDTMEEPAVDVVEEEAPPDPRFVVVTFNTGTGASTGTEGDGDGYGRDEAAISDEHYGNGLAWVEAVDAVRDWFALVRPDVVAFQEIFYSGACPSIAPEYHAGFVCETWATGDPTVAQVLLGSGYQVACHPGKDDKCIAVRKSFGTIRQCSDPDFCLEGLDGERVDGCGSGARVARATIDLVRGGTITVVNYHGSSGILPDDMDCRAQQVEQVFVDMDGEPGANGTRNVVLGDLNTDPGRVPGWLDPSSEAWNEYVGGSQPFQWVSPFGPSATPTYTGGLNIDHVASDAFTGGCFVPGVTAGYPAVYPYVMFDHKPLVCEIGEL
jgi:hypothetical protein